MVADKLNLNSVAINSPWPHIPISHLSIIKHRIFLCQTSRLNNLQDYRYNFEKKQATSDSYR